MNVAADAFLCVDCAMVAANDDSTGIEDARRERIVRAAVHAMGPYLCCGDSERDLEFTGSACDCCDSPAGGSRLHFVILTEGN